MARDGKVDMVLGMWISSIVVAPFGVFFTYKANKDSVVFNKDAYRQFFSHLLGFRTHRHIFRKEVIIEEPRMDVVLSNLCRLKDLCTDYNKRRICSSLQAIFAHSFATLLTPQWRKLMI